MMVKVKRHEYELSIEEKAEIVEDPISSLARDQPMSKVEAPTEETPVGSPTTDTVEDPSTVELPQDQACDQPKTLADASTQIGNQDT